MISTATRWSLIWPVHTARFKIKGAAGGYRSTQVHALYPTKKSWDVIEKRRKGSRSRRLFLVVRVIYCEYFSALHFGLLEKWQRSPKTAVGYYISITWKILDLAYDIQETTTSTILGVGLRLFLTNYITNPPDRLVFIWNSNDRIWTWKIRFVGYEKSYDVNLSLVEYQTPTFLSKKLQK
jgi:hypothetical protein